jgi:hypothetical protein
VVFSASAGAGSGYVYAVTTNGSGATIDSSGRYVAGTTGAVSDVVTVTDALGNTATVTVLVGPAVSLTASNTQSPPRGGVTFTASGGSGSGYVFSLGANASGGSIDPTSGAYTAGATDSVTDTVTVVDSLGNTASASVVVGPSVSISPASPAAPPREHVNLVATGGSGTGYTFAIVTNASGGSIDAATGLYTAGGVGASVDVVRVTDSLGNSATVAISVGNGLSLNPSTISIAPSQSQAFSAVGGTGSGFSFAVTTNASGATIDAASGAYRAGRVGSTVDVVTVTDSAGNTATATLQVGPGLSVTPSTPTLAPLGVQSFAVSGGSGRGYGFVLGTNASGASVDPSTGAYQAGAIGGVTDVVTVTDSLGNTTSVNVTVTAALQAVATTLSAPPRGGVTLAVTGGSGGVTFALTNNGSGASLDPHSGAYLAGSTGSTSDLVTATDSNGASVTLRVNVGAGVSLAPSAPTTAPRATLTFTASGGSGSGYRYSLNSNRSGGSIDVNTGAYQAGTVSSVVDVVQVVDDLGNQATVSVSIGGGLSINPATPQVAPRATVAFAAAGGSGTGFVYALGTNASGGTIDPATGTYHAGATPNVSDQVTVTDSLGNSVTATISVGGGVLVAPASAQVAPNGPLSLSASGGSGSGYTFAISSNNSGGTVSSSTGLYTAGGTANVTDTVTVTDALGNTGTASIAVGAGVSIASPATTAPPRGSLSLTASGGSGNYTFALRANGSGGSVVSTTGRYTAGATPGTTDTVEVSDDLGNRASVVITVGAGVSLAPTSPKVAPGGSLSFTASGGSGTGFTFALSTNGSGGTIDAKSGAYLAGDTTDTADTVTVTDSLGNASSVSVAIGDGVTLNPPTSTVAPHAQIPFAAQGGSGVGYVFSLATNASGATIDPSTGAYQAGGMSNVTDVVKVADSLGKSATATVKVGPGITITPVTAVLAPMSSITFNVSGGSGSGYQFALGPNGSGGTIDPTHGDYRAGATGGTTDVVTVTDALGNVVTATVTVGPGLSISPATAVVPPRGPIALVATGGQGPYVFAVTQNGSGATVDASSGAYVAGAMPGATDIVTVTDANGVSVSTTLTVGPGISITPANPAVTAGATVQLVAKGGAGSGYSWRVVDGSAGGSVDVATGLYTAGRSPASGKSDVVEVKDGLGNSARVTITPTGGTPTGGASSVSAKGGTSGCSCESVNGPRGGWLSLGGVALTMMGLAARRRRSRAGRDPSTAK